MAKLKTLSLELLGETYEFPLKCSSKGWFSTEYPVSVWTVVDTRNRAEFNTLAELEREIHAVVKEVNESSTSTRNLIFIQTSCDERPNDHEGASLSMDFQAIHQKIRGRRVDSFEIRKTDLSAFVRDRYEEVAPGFWTQDSYSTHCSKWHGRKMNLEKCESIPFSPEAYALLEAMRDRVLEIGQKLEDILKPQSVLALSSQSTLPDFFKEDD